MPMAEVPDSLIFEDKAWAPIRFLIGDIQVTETLPAGIYKWDATVSFFRRIERQRMFDPEPREIDLKAHEVYLHLLINLGQHFEERSQKIPDEELAEYGIRRADLSGYVQELKDIWVLWHGQENESAEVPESFKRAMDDFKAGRLVSMETALNEIPPKG